MSQSIKKNFLLRNKVALVTGGSRGVGRGAALGLGEYGATVYITGRNSMDLEQTKIKVEELGGKCIPLKCDHYKDDETDSVLKQILLENSQVAILVNSAWAGYEGMVEQNEFTWNNKFWNQSLTRWDQIFKVGVRTIFVTSKGIVPRMITQGGGLIVNISYWAAKKYMNNIIYGASKAVADKLTNDMAVELESKNIAVVSLYPGLVRTEEVMKNAAYFNLNNSESPQFIGRVISELYLDKEKKIYSGKAVVAASLAINYGISDIDGTQPKPLNMETA